MNSGDRNGDRSPDGGDSGPSSGDRSAAASGDEPPDENPNGTRVTRRQLGAIVGGVTAFTALGVAGWALRPAPIADVPGWEEGPAMAQRRGEMKAATIDGRIYVPGGLRGLGSSTDRLAVLDPEAGEWTSRAPLPTPLNHHGTAALDGRLYVLGGNEDFGDPPGTFSYAYDPSGDEWIELPAVPDGRWGHEAVAHGDRIYVVGGIPDEDDAIDTLVYDPDAETWERAAPTPTRREHVAAAVLDDRIVVVGGRWDGENVAAVAAYDPVTDEWESRSDLPTARSGFGAATIDGRLHAVGGEDPAALRGWTSDAHERYDPAGDEWSARSGAPLELHGNAVVAVDHRLYVIGGAWRQGLWSVTAWSDRVFVYDPAASG